MPCRSWLENCSVTKFSRPQSTTSLSKSHYICLPRLYLQSPSLHSFMPGTVVPLSSCLAPLRFKVLHIIVATARITLCHHGTPALLPCHRGYRRLYLGFEPPAKHSSHISFKAIPFPAKARPRHCGPYTILWRSSGFHHLRRG